MTKTLRQKDKADTLANWHWLACIYTKGLRREPEMAVTGDWYRQKKPIIRYFIWGHVPCHCVNSNFHLDSRTVGTLKEQLRTRGGTWQRCMSAVCLQAYMLVKMSGGFWFRCDLSIYIHFLLLMTQIWGCYPRKNERKTEKGIRRARKRVGDWKMMTEMNGRAEKKSHLIGNMDAKMKQDMFCKQNWKEKEKHMVQDTNETSCKTGWSAPSIWKHAGLYKKHVQTTNYSEPTRAGNPPMCAALLPSYSSKNQSTTKSKEHSEEQEPPPRQTDHSSMT